MWILLVLVAAVASPRVSQVARPLIAAFAFVSAWLLTAVFDELRTPAWTMFTGCAVIVVSIIVIIVTVHRWTQGGDGDESGAGQQDDQGGGGPRRLGRMLCNMYVAVATRASGPSSSANSRPTLPSVSRRRPISRQPGLRPSRSWV
jgi:hypothetical protein